MLHGDQNWKEGFLKKLLKSLCWTQTAGGTRKTRVLTREDNLFKRQVKASQTN